jgi:hypothetical protein
MAIRWLVTGLAILLLSACMAEYEEVSSQEPYRRIIGKRLKSTSKLHIYGVTLDRNYAPTVDVYTVHGPPGIGGPEILSAATLPPGTIFNVSGIRRCTNCPFDERIEIVVEVVRNQKYDDAPVTIPYRLFRTDVVTVLR